VEAVVVDILLLTPTGLYQAILPSLLVVAVMVRALVEVTVAQEALVHLGLFLLTGVEVGLVHQALRQEALTTTGVMVALEEAPTALGSVTEIELAH
jgi:hypothetical protein